MVLRRSALIFLSLLLMFTVHGCTRSRPWPGDQLARRGDEVVVCGQFFHTDTPVVLWMDPGGYDAYRVEQRFAPFAAADWEHSSKKYPELKTPARYNLRKDGLSPEELEAVRGGGWNLPLLQRTVDQFVLHYDQSGTSRQCFNVMHDHRCLSVHFLLDLDGTIYQTLDLKERAWHATTSNSRSVGIEIANIGAFPPDKAEPLAQWYTRDEHGPRVAIPAKFGDGGLRTPDFVARPARLEPVTGAIQETALTQYDFTPQQYAALIKLTAALCRVFPKLRCDFPHDDSGEVVPRKLPDEHLVAYQGLIGHYHIQTNKVDPGPALQWRKVVEGARRLLDENKRD